MERLADAGAVDGGGGLLALVRACDGGVGNVLLLLVRWTVNGLPPLARWRRATASYLWYSGEVSNLLPQV